MDRHTDTVKTTPPKSHKQGHTYMILIHILTPRIFFSQIYTKYLFPLSNFTVNIFLFIILPATHPPPQPHAHTQGKIPEHVGDVHLQVEG